MLIFLLWLRGCVFIIVNVSVCCSVCGSHLRVSAKRPFLKTSVWLPSFLHAPVMTTHQCLRCKLEVTLFSWYVPWPVVNSLLLIVRRRPPQQFFCTVPSLVWVVFSFLFFFCLIEKFYIWVSLYIFFSPVFLYLFFFPSHYCFLENMYINL